MPINDLTIRKLPKVQFSDSFTLEHAEQSTRPDTITIQFTRVGKVLVSVPIGQEVKLGRFEMSEMGPSCLNIGPFGGIEFGVSRRHAKIKHLETGWWIEDMGSSNGTWLEKERLTPLNPRKLGVNTHLFLAQLECFILLPDNRTKPTHRFTL
jgi:hypothetical protein